MASLAAILSTIVAALKSFPALAQLVNRFVDEWKSYDIRKREADAATRLATKDLSVDTAIDGIRLSGAKNPAEQQPTIDGANGLAICEDCRARVVQGCTKDNQSTGSSN